jgi:subtilase family serine protease
MRPGARLRVEELESRTLLSAAAVFAQPGALVLPAGLTGATPYTPAQVANAYGFNQVAFSAGGKSVAADGSGQTIAIVDAYDDPHVVSDLQAFDKKYGLPDPTFAKATPGGTPAVNSTWDLEISLDVEWAHAIAPGAKILLVEAATNSISDLLTAVRYAAGYAGVSVVSMSWTSPEFAGESNLDSNFLAPAGHAPVAFVASSGDAGAASGASWPAVSRYVLSVGGASLHLTASGGYAGETAWSGSGGGYSGFSTRMAVYEPEPAYQRGVQQTNVRTTPDVAYDADPATGFSVYDGGWVTVGGTSAGAPQWAALIALADQGRALAGLPALANVPADVYALAGSATTAGDFHDVVGGSNGYTAVKGYDLATGLGSPVANRLIADLVKVSEQPAAAKAASAAAGPAGVATPAGRSAPAGAAVGETPPGQAGAVGQTEWVFAALDPSYWRRVQESAWGYRGDA